MSSFEGKWEVRGHKAKSLSVRKIVPPFRGFFSKAVQYHGFLIMSHEDVSDEALFKAHSRISEMLRGMPEVFANLLHAKAEFHVIGKDQVTSDLPEHRRRWRKPKKGNISKFDIRVRGSGGLFSSCAEENLLSLPGDVMPGHDICVHEFAHCLMDFGFDAHMRNCVQKQYDESKHLWLDTYAKTNKDEYFAEMSMWYFESQGDCGTMVPPPGRGRKWLADYDRASFKLLDKIYQGRLYPKHYEPAMVTNSVLKSATTAFELFRSDSDFDGDAENVYETLLPPPCGS